MVLDVYPKNQYHVVVHAIQNKLNQTSPMTVVSIVIAGIVDVLVVEVIVALMGMRSVSVHVME